MVIVPVTSKVLVGVVKKVAVVYMVLWLVSNLLEHHE